MRSDTLNGLLLYRMAEDEGDAAVAEAIEAFREGEPPFAVSSAFPEGFLPMPKLPALRRERLKEFFDGGLFGGLPFFDVLQKVKGFHKLPWLPFSLWEKLAGALSGEAIFREWIAGEELFSPRTERSAREPHVTVSRAEGTALHGGLFFRRASFFPEGARLHLYAETADPAALRERLARIGMLGYGKDATSGRGRFDVERDMTFRVPAGDGTHALLLSRYAAPTMTAPDGWYGVEVKRGYSGAGTGRGPYKAPFLSLREGSVLRGLAERGAVLEGLHADDRIVQVLTPVSLPCTPEENV